MAVAISVSREIKGGRPDPRAGAAALAGTAALLLLVTGCTSAGGGGGGTAAAPPSSTAPSSVSVPAATGTRAPGGTPAAVVHALRPTGEKVLLNVGPRTGSVELAVPKKPGAGPLAVEAACQGMGTMTVRLSPTWTEFQVDCVEGEVTATRNEMRSATVPDLDTARITASPNVHWALLVEQ
ncbi:hypothetical protein AB0C52_17280 [Streptomyces sp. NPDC048717]|uniref:hypothetical protein n=1 Tax=Streptomyces sp. NPDC048717 TaxID=3154928 RepID=UPI00343A6085